MTLAFKALNLATNRTFVPIERSVLPVCVRDKGGPGSPKISVMVANVPAIHRHLHQAHGAVIIPKTYWTENALNDLDRASQTLGLITASYDETATASFLPSDESHDDVPTQVTEIESNNHDDGHEPFVLVTRRNRDNQQEAGTPTFTDPSSGGVQNVTSNTASGTYGHPGLYDDSSRGMRNLFARRAHRWDSTDRSEANNQEPNQVRTPNQAEIRHHVIELNRALRAMSREERLDYLNQLNAESPQQIFDDLDYDMFNFILNQWLKLEADPINLHDTPQGRRKHYEKMLLKERALTFAIKVTSTDEKALMDTGKAAHHAIKDAIGEQTWDQLLRGNATRVLWQTPDIAQAFISVEILPDVIADETTNQYKDRLQQINSKVQEYVRNNHRNTVVYTSEISHGTEASRNEPEEPRRQPNNREHNYNDPNARRTNAAHKRTTKNKRTRRNKRTQKNKRAQGRADNDPNWRNDQNRNASPAPRPITNQNSTPHAIHSPTEPGHTCRNCERKGHHNNNCRSNRTFNIRLEPYRGKVSNLEELQYHKPTPFSDDATWNWYLKERDRLIAIERQRARNTINNIPSPRGVTTDRSPLPRQPIRIQRQQYPQIWLGVRWNRHGVQCSPKQLKVHPRIVPPRLAPKEYTTQLERSIAKEYRRKVNKHLTKLGLRRYHLPCQMSEGDNINLYHGSTHHSQPIGVQRVIRRIRDGFINDNLLYNKNTLHHCNVATPIATDQDANANNSDDEDSGKYDFSDSDSEGKKPAAKDADPQQRSSTKDEGKHNTPESQTNQNPETDPEGAALDKTPAYVNTNRGSFVPGTLSPEQQEQQSEAKRRQATNMFSAFRKNIASPTKSLKLPALTRPAKELEQEYDQLLQNQNDWTRTECQQAERTINELIPLYHALRNNTNIEIENDKREDPTTLKAKISQYQHFTDRCNTAYTLRWKAQTRLAARHDNPDEPERKQPPSSQNQDEQQQATGSQQQAAADDLSPLPDDMDSSIQQQFKDTNATLQDFAALLTPPRQEQPTQVDFSDQLEQNANAYEQPQNLDPVTKRLHRVPDPTGTFIHSSALRSAKYHSTTKRRKSTSLSHGPPVQQRPRRQSQGTGGGLNFSANFANATQRTRVAGASGGSGGGGDDDDDDDDDDGNNNGGNGGSNNNNGSGGGSNNGRGNQPPGRTPARNPPGGGGNGQPPGGGQPPSQQPPGGGQPPGQNPPQRPGNVPNPLSQTITMQDLAELIVHLTNGSKTLDPTDKFKSIDDDDTDSVIVFAPDGTQNPIPAMNNALRSRQTKKIASILK